MQNVNLDARLAAAAELIEGSYIADVGTDHGFLPVFLCSKNPDMRAVASDIKKAPLERAVKNVSAHSLEDRIDTVLTPGLSGLEKYPLSDIVICGMGGLTIIEILENAPFVKNGVHLILQPMQHMSNLRRYLCENGYDIDKESLARADGRVYQIISARYTGRSREISEIDAILGEYNIAHKADDPELFSELCRRNASFLIEKINGYEKSCKDAENEKLLLEKINSLMGGQNGNC